MQKKQAQNSQDIPSPEPARENDIKTILEEILMGKQKTVAPVPEIMQETPQAIEVTNNHVPPKKRRPSKLALARDKEKYSTEEEFKEKPFDLKQALIYSEILKRPEY